MSSPAARDATSSSCSFASSSTGEPVDVQPERSMYSSRKISPGSIGGKRSVFLDIVLLSAVISTYAASAPGSQDRLHASSFQQMLTHKQRHCGGLIVLIALLRETVTFILRKQIPDLTAIATD